MCRVAVWLLVLLVCCLMCVVVRCVVHVVVRCAWFVVAVLRLVFCRLVAFALCVVCVFV